MAKGPRKLFGDLLVGFNLITGAQLQEALQQQYKTGERLGRILIGQGYLTEQQVNGILELQLGIPQVSLLRYPLDGELIRTVPEALIRRHRVIPLKRVGDKLTLAMSDPLNLVAIDDLSLATGADIEPSIASEQEIDQVIRKEFGLTEAMERAFREIGVGGEGQGEDIFDLDRRDGAVADAPTVRVVNTIIQGGIKEQASDIHIEIHEGRLRIRYRIDGLLQDVMNLPKQSHASLVSRIKIMAGMDIAEKRLPQDGRIQIRSGRKSVDLRISSLPTIFGEKVVIRILDKSNLLLRLEQLGFQEEVLERYRNIICHTYGLVLVTGPTGSGKTTTLYATLNEVNDSGKNIITLEDPVEYILDGINQVQVNPKVGLDFASGLRSILRQDPDWVLVGEIRDRETADMAVKAATTGHLVMSTLHTNDAAGAITRLLDMGVEPFLVASSLVGVVAQRLLRLICPMCKISYTLPYDSPERVYLGISREEPLILYRGRGCVHCNNTGYKGRIAIHEVMIINNRQREFILAKAPAEILRQEAISAGMITLREDGIKKVMDGFTTVQEVMRVAYSGGL